MARASGASDYRSGELSHQDERGAAHMVDITEKATTKRTAVAAGILRTSAQVVALISTGGLPKGDALATARVAGIMAAKRTSDLIPLCHQLRLPESTSISPSASWISRSQRRYAVPTERASRWKR